MIRKTLDISTIDYKARSSKRTRIYFPCEIKDSIADCALSALAANGLDAADVKEINILCRTSPPIICLPAW